MAMAASARVLILGGYGNFGKRIARALVRDGVPVIIAGRDGVKAGALAQELGPLAQSAVFDANVSLSEALGKYTPAVLINTCGPFQTADYRIAEACIAKGVHYIDLADGRDFVTGITTLDARAQASGVTVISGASTVPGLSSAVIEAYRHEFAVIDRLVYGISPGHKASRGLATTQSILSYTGKRLKPFAGHPNAYGWQGLYRQEYPHLGTRWMANCDVPDLDLLPTAYGIGSIRFSAGLELGFMHLGLWALGWLVRLGLPLHLPRYAAMLLSIADRISRAGSADGGMHMRIEGRGPHGQPHRRDWFIIAKDGYGPHIPTIPAILLAKRLCAAPHDATPLAAGAYPCMGNVTLADYLAALAEYPVSVTTTIYPAQNS